MNKLGILATLLALTGCQTTYESTSPGAALPSGIAWCNGHDAIGRCTDWSAKTDQCINPKGINEPEPTVPCNKIINGKYKQ